MPFVSSVRGAIGPVARNDNKQRRLSLDGITDITGGSITTAGGYRIHTFLSNGTYSIPNYLVNGTAGIDHEILIIGGGGGGPGGDGMAGGAAGGALYANQFPLTSESYSVSIGTGGPRGYGGGHSRYIAGQPGNASTFGSLSAPGGEYGAGRRGGNTSTPAVSGATAYSYNGGSAGSRAGGGGAGLSGNGTNGSGETGGRGGYARTFTITGSSVQYGGGGGGGGCNGTGGGANGGGGATSGLNGGGSGTQRGPATANRGSGGGGGGHSHGSGQNTGGGPGGTGIVVVRYLV